MTTQQSPDGQTQTDPTQTNDAVAGDDEPIRNMGDLRRLVATREEMKEIRAVIDAFSSKLDALAKPQAPDPAAPSAPATPPSAVEQLAAKVEALLGREDAKAKTDRRHAIMAGVAAHAQESQREMIRGAVAMMHIDGEIDLTAEATQAEVDKALTKLRAKYPGAFAAAGNASPAAGIRHGDVPPGTPLHEYTREQLARLTPEEVNKLRKASRTSGLAV